MKTHWEIAGTELCRSFMLLLVLLSAIPRAQFLCDELGVLTVTKYTGTNTDVEIPAHTNGHPVTSIGSDA